MYKNWDDNFEEDDALDVVNRYKQMILHNNPCFFDLYEFESIIDYFIDQFSYKDAITAVNHALQQHPYASSIKLKHSQLLIDTGKPGRALGILRSIYRYESLNYEYYLARGVALNLTGKIKDAITDFEKAFHLCTENREEVAYTISQSFVQIEKYNYAIRYLLMACTHNPDNLLVLYDLALNYERIECLDKSIEYYKKYLEIDPFAEHVWNNLGLLYTSTKDIHNASMAFDFAIAINPNYYTAFFNKADLYVLQHDLIAAVEVYKDLLGQDGSNTRALCEMGNCFEEDGRYAEALKSYEKAILISEDCADAWFGKSMVYYKQKKYRTSLASLKKAISIQPANSDFWFMLGEIFSRLRKFDQAIVAFSRASELNPLDFEAFMACAQVLFRKRRIGKAIEMLLQLYHHNHENPTLNYRLAAYYAYQDEFQSACSYFEKGLRLSFHEHQEMFRMFPKTRSFHGFLALLENHLQLQGAIVTKTN
jgi:tetratricopeptide (TPR) repeat protein